MKKQAKGFTLIEVVIVLAIMGILIAIAFPSFIQWQKNAQYKAAARQLSGVLMEARSRAIATNLEHEIAFDLDENIYMLRMGNLAANTRPYSSNPGDWTIIYNNRSFTNAVEIKAKIDCSETAADNYRFQFFPNGTFKVNGAINANDSYICIVDNASGAMQFRVGVPAAATGRVVLIK